MAVGRGRSSGSGDPSRSAQSVSTLLALSLVRGVVPVVFLGPISRWAQCQTFAADAVVQDPLLGLVDLVGIAEVAVQGAGPVVQVGPTPAPACRGDRRT